MKENKLEFHYEVYEDSSELAEKDAWLLNEARLAVVPFYAFGADRTSPWYRLSVGTCKKEEIPEMIETLRKALQKLS